MPLTDVEIRRAKAKEKAYRMSDGGRFLFVVVAGGSAVSCTRTSESE